MRYHAHVGADRTYRCWLFKRDQHRTLGVLRVEARLNFANERGGFVVVDQLLKRTGHGLPPALLAFAEKMAVQMEEAELSQDKAKIFFTELEDCVLNQKDKNAVSVQAICLMNAEDLSEVYPDLAGKYQGPRKGASMEVLRMLEGVEAGE